MSFQQGLSGLNAASRGLEVIGNNIANANTMGAKSSRAEFSDVYAHAINGVSSDSVGIGVEVGTVAQLFSQGNISATGNDLDLAINGNGFFQLSTKDGMTVYGRDGQFKLDKDGKLVTNGGNQIMGFPTDTSGKKTNNTPIPMILPTGKPIAPQPTSSITAEINLDAATPAASATTPITSIGTSLKTYDTQGLEVPVALYFVKTATANTWDVYTSVNGAAPTKQGGLEFAADGSLVQTLDTAGVTTGTKGLPVTLQAAAGGLNTWNANIDFQSCTQLGASFSVSQLAQDGWAPGQLNGVKINANGVITARYSNGQSQAAGQIALVNFRNPQGLFQLGGGTWAETVASGQPARGAPGEGNLGAVQSGALEESNVDLTAELVNMMTAQRAYQANAQTIKTQDQLMTTLINMR